MSEDDEDWDRQLGPAGRSRLYKAQAAALDAQHAASHLPRERAKLRAAADRFRELAAAEDRILLRKQRAAMAADAARGQAGADSGTSPPSVG